MKKPTLRPVAEATTWAMIRNGQNLTILHGSGTRMSADPSDSGLVQSPRAHPVPGMLQSLGPKRAESGMSSREALREIGSGRSSSKHWRTCGPWSRLASVLGLARPNRQTRCRARCNPAAVLPQAIAVQALRRVAVSRLQLPHGGFHFVLEGLPFLRLGRLERIER